MRIPSLSLLIVILSSGLRLHDVVASEENNAKGVGRDPESDMDHPHRQLWSAESELQLEESDHPLYWKQTTYKKYIIPFDHYHGKSKKKKKSHKHATKVLVSPYAYAKGHGYVRRYAPRGHGYQTAKGRYVPLPAKGYYEWDPKGKGKGVYETKGKGFFWSKKPISKPPKYHTSPPVASVVPVASQAPVGSTVPIAAPIIPPVASIITPDPTPVPSDEPSTARQCEIQVQLECEEAGTGKKCDAIEPVDFLVCDCDKQCAVTYKLHYTGAHCSQTKEGNTCYDIASGSKPETALITVINEQAGRTLFNDLVNLNDEFTLFNSGKCIPEIIFINIYDAFGSGQQLHQTLKVNTRCSGTGLSLRESVGAVDFTGYACPNSVTRNCLTEVSFDICGKNIGPVPFDVTRVLLDFDGEMREVTKDSSKMIEPGEIECFVSDIRWLDTCLPRQHVAMASIDGDDHGCNNTHSVHFTMDPPGPNPVEPIVTPRPTSPPTAKPTTRPTMAKQCEIEVQVECEDAASPGKTCDVIEPVDFLVCHCGGECTVNHTFQYTGAHCDTAKPGNMCQDLTNASKPEEALIFVDDNGQTLFQGHVEINDEFTLFKGEGNCIPPNVNISIYDAFYPDQPYQLLTINTQCTGTGLSLKDSVGAVDFTGYACPDGVTRNCWKKVTLEACAENVGPIPLDVTSMILAFGGEESELTDSGSNMFQSGELYCAENKGWIDTCSEGEYVAVVSIFADDSFSTESCESTNGLKFNMSPPGPDPPTSAPVEPITTPKPTNAPVANVETSKPSPKPTPKPFYSKGKGAIPVAKGKGAYVISKGKGGQVPVTKIFLVAGKSGKKHGKNRSGGHLGWKSGKKHKKKSGHYPKVAPFEFNYHYHYNKYHDQKEEIPKQPPQSDSTIEPPQQKRMDAPPRRPIPQPRAFVDTAQTKIIEAPKPLQQPLASIYNVQQKIVEAAPPRKPIPSTADGMINQPLPGADTAQQKIAEAPPETASQEKIAGALYTKIAEGSPRKPLPTDSALEQAQTLVGESTARDPQPSKEDDGADGTDQIKNWFLS